MKHLSNRRNEGLTYFLFTVPGLMLWVLLIFVPIFMGLYYSMTDMMPLVILNKSTSFWTLTLYQYNFQTAYSIEYNLLFTVCFMSVVPILVVYIFLQKYIISGLTQGALKG